MSARARHADETCPVCLLPARLLPLRGRDERARDVLDMLAQTFPEWEGRGGLCSTCWAQFAHARQVLPEGLRDEAGRLLPILPVRVRLRAQTDLEGRGVGIAFLDSGFHPHPDLIEPRSRIVAYHSVLAPERPVSNQIRDLDESSWHGLMTSVVCAGNGRLSQGFYRGLASAAHLVLVKVGTARRIRPEDIERGLLWVLEHAERWGIRVVNVSCGGDDALPYLRDPLCQAVERLVAHGVTVVCAAGNAGHAANPIVIPPASAPSAITVGGWNDGNRLNALHAEPYWSSYGPTVDGLQKPEVVAPAIWLAAPILPATPTHAQAQLLARLDRTPNAELRAVLAREPALDDAFAQVKDASPVVIRNLVASMKRKERLISGHYQHVDGTSFAAPLVTSLVALAYELRPELAPWEIKRLLIDTAEPLPGVPRDRQGWGTIQPHRFLATLTEPRRTVLPHRPNVAGPGTP